VKNPGKQLPNNKENTNPKMSIMSDSYVSIEDLKLLENRIKDSNKSSSRLKENFNKLNKKVNDV